MATRKAISKRTRFEVFKRDNFKCQYCGKSAPDAILCVDHIKPRSKAGGNALINLVTACVECNSGKSDVLLADSSAVSKQRKQLEDLEERRSQLEMMLKWREGLADIEGRKLEIICDHWARRVPGSFVNEHGKNTLRKLLRKYQVSDVLDAIDTVSDDCPNAEEGAPIAFRKLGALCRFNALPDDEKRLFYIRGICRNRLGYINEYECLDWLRCARTWGITLESLTDIAKTAGWWTDWIRRMDAAIAKVRDDV